MRLEHAVDLFLIDVRTGRGLSESTCEAYGRALGALLETLGNVSAQNLDARAVQRHLARMESCGLAPSTRARSLSAIAGLLAYLRSEGVIASDPMGELQRPRKGRRIPRVLNLEQVFSEV